MRLTFGGKEFDLKPLTVNDLIDAEENHGLSITKMKDPKDFTIRNLRSIFYLVLHKADETVTQEWVGEHMDINDNEVTQNIVNFMSPAAKPIAEATG